MKKILSVFLALLMVVSCFALAGCSKSKSKNLYENLDDFDSHVAENSIILGDWTENISADSTADEIKWCFLESTSLHIRETKDGVSFTTACTYNYDEETGKLSYYIFQNKKVYDAQVEISGNKMVFKEADGDVIRTFVKTQ